MVETGRSPTHGKTRREKAPGGFARTTCFDWRFTLCLCESITLRPENEKFRRKTKKNPLLDGVTFSGGEPLCQAAALLPLAKEIKKLGLNLFIYTGSIFEDLLKEQNPDIMALLQQGDFLVDGPFVEAKKNLSLRFRGSENQRLIDVPASLAAGKTILWQDWQGEKRGMK